MLDGARIKAAKGMPSTSASAAVDMIDHDVSLDSCRGLSLPAPCNPIDPFKRNPKFPRPSPSPTISIDEHVTRTAASDKRQIATVILPTATERMTIVARPVLAAALEKRLIASGIPLVSLASACAGCDGHQEGDGDNDQGYPASFDVDMESDLLGTMSGYERQIVISTGKSDWQREVTEREEGKEVETLAMLVYEGYQALQKDKVEQSTSIADADSKVDRLPGIYPSTRPASHSDVLSLDSISLDTVSTLQLPSTRLSVINGSFLSSSDSNDHHSVLLFPDYISIHDVEGSKEGSDELLERYLTSKVGASSSTATSTMKSWPLPYEAVVLICSHKKRDKRCHIAAPLLISQVSCRSFYRHPLRLNRTTY